MRKEIFGLTLVLILCSTLSFAKQFSADMVTKGIMGGTKGKIYFKSSKVNRTEFMGMINITDGDKVYTIVPATKSYVVSTIEEMQEENPAGVYGDVKELVKRNNLQKTGKEEIQGYNCIVYSGEIKVDESEPSVPVVIWYSKKLDTIVKQEISLEPPVGKMTVSLENIVTKSLDADLFKVPNGYAEAESMEAAMGLGIPQDAMPSEENMQDMMDQVQNMLEQMQSK